MSYDDTGGVPDHGPGLVMGESRAIHDAARLGDARTFDAVQSRYGVHGTCPFLVRSMGFLGRGYLVRQP